MGGEDKDAKTSKPSGQLIESESCESLFDRAVSKLLQDFTSAELFPQSTNCVKAVSCGRDCNCDSMISSLKYLHLRRPVPARQRKQRKYDRRHYSANKLNLAVAAGNYQKPIVWPSRLNSQCKEKQSNPYVLHPSRLCRCMNDNLLKSDILNTTVGDPKGAIKMCSCQEKSRIEAALSRQISKPFSRGSGQTLSFANLLLRDDDSSNESITSCALSKDKNSIAVSKRSSADRFPPAKFAKLATSGAAFSDYRHLGHFDSVDHEEAQVKSLFQFPTVAAKGSPLFSCDKKHSAHKQSESGTPSPSGLDTLAPLRSALCSAIQPSSQSCASPCSVSCSCSQEMKMEDTNVNELASYFEDFLHIPRKMSTMAEMMYA